MKQRAVIFDFNGTIADTSKITFDAINKMSEKYGYEKITMEEVLSLRDKDIREIVKMYKIPFYKLPFILRDIRKEMADNIKDALAYNGLKQLLTKLKKEKFLLFVVSSDSGDNIRAFLKNNDINIFDKIFGDLGLFAKSKIVKNIVSSENLDANEVYYVGDEVRDIECGSKAGVRVISVSWGFNTRKSLEKYSPDFIADEPEQILDFLKKD